MGTAFARFKMHSEACNILNSLVINAANVFIIHYSCESFYDRPDGHTPRVTSIAIRNLDTGQTHSFSIHKIAELTHVAPTDITAGYDRLEKEMLDEYFDYVRTHQGFKWVHWNMRNINYGFPAIEHRYRVLGGTPVIIDDSRKEDLSRLLVAKYGIGYLGHPRLENLIKKNKITDLDFLTGKQEAEAFDAGDYVRLHQSTLRKVDILANILGRATDNSLKTNAKWSEIYGITPQAVGGFIKEHWLPTIIGFILTIIGFIVSVVSIFKK